MKMGTLSFRPEGSPKRALEDARHTPRCRRCQDAPACAPVRGCVWSIDGATLGSVVFSVMNTDPSQPAASSANIPGWERGPRIAGLAAVGAVFSMPFTVDAGIVYSGLRNLTMSLPVGARPASDLTFGVEIATQILDLDGDLQDDLGFLVGQAMNSVVRYGLVQPSGSMAKLVLKSTGVGAGSFVANLPVGKTIASGSGLWGYGGLIRGVAEGTKGIYELGIKPGSPALLGVSFTRSGDVHFGWLRLLLEDGPVGFPVSLTVVDWAWEDQAFAGIRAGEVPEANPALAMLAAGGTGLAAWRLGRRKRSAGGEG